MVSGNPPPQGVALAGWLRESAAKLGVSGAALKWRLVNASVIKRTEAAALSDDLLCANAEDNQPQMPARYSKRFVSVMSWGIGEGHVSVSGVAQLLDIPVDELRDLFAEHGLASPFDL